MKRIIIKICNQNYSNYTLLALKKLFKSSSPTLEVTSTSNETKTLSILSGPRVNMDSKC